MVTVTKRTRGGTAPRGFSGSVAKTGNSRGLRLEKAFFQAAPEFGKIGSAVQADLIGPGTFIVRVKADAPPAEDSDPIIGAWLSFLDQDMRSNPSSLAPFSVPEMEALERLVQYVTVDDDEDLPNDVTV